MDENLQELQTEITSVKLLLTKLMKDLEERLPNFVPIQKCYAPHKVCELLDINIDTLGRMRREGRIQFKSISGGSFRYPANQPLLTQAMERQKTILERRT